MTLAETIRIVRAKGKPGAAAVYRRHGVTQPTVGLSYADLGVLVKRIGVDHALALKLWDTGLHDARVLATKVADPARLTKATLASWLKACTNYVITDAVASTAAKVPGILPLALAWSMRRREWTSAAGWSVLAILSMHDEIEDALATSLIARVESEIHTAPNRTRYSMNNALIAIGGSMPAARQRALAAAKSIGAVHVDHGETGCRTPDAVSMIGKMVEHRAARAFFDSVKTEKRGKALFEKARPLPEAPDRNEKRSRRPRATGVRVTTRPRKAATRKGARKAR